MYCRNCGKQIYDHSEFCPECESSSSRLYNKPHSTFEKTVVILSFIFFLSVSIFSFLLSVLFILISILDTFKWLIAVAFLSALFVFSIVMLVRSFRNLKRIFKKQTVVKDAPKIEYNPTSNFQPNVNSEKEYTTHTSSYVNLARNDNYATAAMLRWSEYGKPLGDVKEDYPHYLESTYKIHNPIKYHQKLIDMGYLVPADPSLFLSTLKVAELKQILSEHGLKTSGKKAELLKLIVDNIDCSTLNLKKFYIPSPTGKAHLKEYEYVFRLYHYNISVGEFENFQTNYNPHTDANSIIFDILCSRYSKYYENNAFGLASNEMLHISAFFEDCNAHEKSLFFLIVHFYLSFYDAVREPELFLDFLDLSVIKIYNKKEYFSPDLVYKCCENFKLPIEPITPNDFIRLLNDIFADKPIDFYDYLIINK